MMEYDKSVLPFVYKKICTFGHSGGCSCYTVLHKFTVAVKKERFDFLSTNIEHVMNSERIKKYGSRDGAGSKWPPVHKV